MEAITLFDHEQFGEVRITDQDGEPWFVAKDVAAALGYAKTDDAVRRHCRRAKSLMISTPASHGGVSRPKIIPESDVYRLIFRSKLPEAEKFLDWVVEEVLPSIRRTGKYELDKKAVEMISLRKREGFRLLAEAHEFEIVGKKYLERYVVQGVAAIEGKTAEGPYLLDISTYLESKGFAPSEIRSSSPQFGKKLKASYMKRHGQEPEKARRFINGSERSVFCYTEEDLDLFDGVYELMFEEEVV